MTYTYAKTLKPGDKILWEPLGVPYYGTVTKKHGATIEILWNNEKKTLVGIKANASKTLFWLNVSKV